LLVIYTPSHVCSARDPGLARRLAEGSAPKRETRVTISYVVFAMPRKSGRLGGVAGSVVEYVIIRIL
jgi:hypothetical protein